MECGLARRYWELMTSKRVTSKLLIYDPPGGVAWARCCSRQDGQRQPQQCEARHEVARLVYEVDERAAEPLFEGGFQVERSAGGGAKG